MRQYLAAALLAALALTGSVYNAEAQTKKIKGKLMPTRTVTTRVITTQTTPSYRIIEHRFYQPYTGYRRVITTTDDNLLSEDRLLRDGIEYRRTWVPGYFGDNDQWISGHYEWTATEE
jgi:hypothetical protein